MILTVAEVVEKVSVDVKTLGRETDSTTVGITLLDHTPLLSVREA